MEIPRRGAGIIPTPLLCITRIRRPFHEQKTVRDIDVKGKRVFCRVDFNVPMQNGVVTDDTRIRAALPTIQYLMEQGAKVILASHLGRPKGKVVEEMRLTAVAERLSELLGKRVVKTDEAYGDAVKAAIAQMNEGDVLLLETSVSILAKRKTIQSWRKHLQNLLTYMSTMRLGQLTAHMLQQKVLRIIYLLLLAS